MIKRISRWRAIVYVDETPRSTSVVDELIRCLLTERVYPEPWKPVPLPERRGGWSSKRSSGISRTSDLVRCPNHISIALYFVEGSNGGSQCSIPSHGGELRGLKEDPVRPDGCLTETLDRGSSVICTTLRSVRLESVPVPP